MVFITKLLLDVAVGSLKIGDFKFFLNTFLGLHINKLWIFKVLEIGVLKNNPSLL